MDRRAGRSPGAGEARCRRPAAGKSCWPG